MNPSILLERASARGHVVLNATKLRIHSLISQPPTSRYHYVFHHVGKTGGSSLILALSQWFIIRKDYPNRRNEYGRLKQLRSLPHFHLLSGHWGQAHGSSLFERYPECLEDSSVRIISFVREPLDLAISGYFFAKKIGILSPRNTALEEHLLTHDNFLAGTFRASSESYRQVLDRYWFIGVFEELQCSFDCLANLLGKPRVVLPQVNRSARVGPKVSPDIRDEFRRLNPIDYDVYDYAMARYKQRCNSLLGG
jgi:hypothetical protein